LILPARKIKRNAAVDDHAIGRAEPDRLEDFAPDERDDRWRTGARASIGSAHVNDYLRQTTGRDMQNAAGVGEEIWDFRCRKSYGGGRLSCGTAAPASTLELGDLRVAANPEKDFQHDVDTIRADIAALTDTVGKLASAAVNAAVGRGPTKKGKRGRASNEMWHETDELGADMVGAAEHLIARNPTRAVLIALGVGLVVALFGFR
jgi:ElaB/YqjD/DUF883 family membrane-anchored ribosome-binding protein